MSEQDENPTPDESQDDEQASSAGHDGNVDELPEWARKALSKANSEAASYRTKLREVEPLAAKARELEESQKTEQQKLAEALEAAKTDGKNASDELLRLRVAMRKGLTESQAKRLVGSTLEELEADADELLASFGSKTPVPGKPRERLRAGGDPDEEPDETDPAKLAAKLPRV